MENNWRGEDARQKIVNRIMDTLHRHMPQIGVDGMQELRKIAIRFEEEIFSNSRNQQDYLRKISMKMLSFETKANNNNNQFPAGANQRPIEHTSVASSSQAGQPVIAKWQENVYSWRHEDARQKIVNKIMDTLHRHMPQTGVDGMQELSKIAIRFEEEIFSNSQNQQDYLRKISMKMLSLETKANNNNNQFPAGANHRPIEHSSVASSSQAGQPVIAEWQENVYQRPMPLDLSEKFKHYKAQLQRLLNYFDAPKNAIPANFKEEHVEALEKRV